MNEEMTMNSQTTTQPAQAGLQESAQTAKPWYKEPLMWLVLGLPATVVVAGVSTVIIASSNPETLVSAPHTKVGLTVERIQEPAQK